MNRNNKTSSITEAAMIAGILVIIALLSSFASIATLFYPTPAIILAKRKGIKYTGLSLLAADIIIAILLGATTGFMYFILYTPFSLALAYGVYKDESANKTLIYGTAAYMVSFVVLILSMNALMGVNFVDELKTAYVESYDMAEGMLSNMPQGASTQDIDKALESMKVFKDTSDYVISNLFPSMVVMVSVIASYVNYIIAVKFSKRFSININKFAGMSYFTFPRTFMIAMAALLLISYLLGGLGLNVRVIQLNLFSLVFLAMVLQGIAVIKFFLEKSQMKKSLKTLLMLIIIYIAFFSGMILVVAIVGLIDLSIDLRKINKAI